MLDGFEKTTFKHSGKKKTVYRAGTGPGVIVIHEIPGITPAVAAFGQKVVDAGFTVFMPSLFGTPGKEFSTGYMAGQMARACISREFHVLAENQSSPVTDWLRALARSAHEELGGKGVGALGMCLTGNFALSMMMEPAVMAPVLSQPSLPFGLTKAKKAAVHISPEEMDNLKTRVAKGDCVLGLRFKSDVMVPDARFETLKRELGDGFEAIELEDEDANPDAPGPPHSVLTKDLVDEEGAPTKEALNRVLGFFHERLVG